MVDELKLGLYCVYYYFHDSNNHEAFKHFINSKKEIIEAHRISGSGCFLLKVKFDMQETLNSLLDEILKFGNYQLHISISEVKNTHPINAIL